MIRPFIAAALGIAAPAGAQDIPGTSPMDHAAASRALTSSQIDNRALGEVAGAQRTRRARPKGRTAGPARSAETKAACARSTPILKSMGLAPHPDCL